MDTGFNQAELVMLLLGLAGLVILGITWRRLGDPTQRGFLGLAVISLVAAWAATNLEDLFWAAPFEIIDHLGYLLFGVLICAWCISLCSRGERGRR